MWSWSPSTMTEPVLSGSLAAGDRRARRAILRAAIGWSPLLVLLTALTGYNLVRLAEGEVGVGGGLTGAVTALISVLVGYSAIQAIRDLFADPVETRGAIGRKWIKAELLLLRRRYVAVGHEMFRVPKPTFTALPDPPAWISVLHYPHTLAVIAWRELDAMEQPAATAQIDEDATLPVEEALTSSWAAAAPAPPPEGALPGFPAAPEPPPAIPPPSALPAGDPP